MRREEEKKSRRANEKRREETALDFYFFNKHNLYAHFHETFTLLGWALHLSHLHHLICIISSTSIPSAYASDT
jgi:hypothetical protein